MRTMLHLIFEKVMHYGKQAGRLGKRVRQQVFGFRLRYTTNSDRQSISVKLLHGHRLLQRRRAFTKAGGNSSSMAQHALKKAQHSKQQF